MSDRWLYAWGIGAVSFGGASLLVPLYLVQLGGSPVDLGVLAAVAALVGAPGAILFGRLGAAVSRRRPLVILTMLGAAVALLLIPFVETITGIIVLNALLWFVVASVGPVLTLIVVDRTPESAWSVRIGRLNAYQGYGWAGGLVLGTVWLAVAPRLGVPDATATLFWGLALCATLGAVGTVQFLPRSSGGAIEPSPSQVRRIGRLLTASTRGIRGATFALSPMRLYWTTRDLRPAHLTRRLTPPLTTYFVAAALFFGGFAAFWAPLPLFLTETGFDTSQVFTLYLVSSLGSAGLYAFAGRLSAHLDMRRLQWGALTVRGALFPALVFAATLGSIGVAFGTTLAGLAAVGMTWAVIAVVGTAIVTRLSPPVFRGEALGVHTALAAVAGGVGGLLGGWMASFGYLAAFAVAGGVVVLGGLLVLRVRAISGMDRPVDGVRRL